MDKIKEYDKQIALIKRLIAVETEDKEIEKLNAELVEAVEMRAAEKFRVEQEEKDKKTAADIETKTIKDKQDSQAVQVVITEAGSYKGVNLKKTLAIASMKSPKMEKRIKENRDGAEKIAKMLVDLTQNAVKMPGQYTKAMTEGTTTAGGYLTPTDERMEVLSYMREDSIALRNAKIEMMTGDVRTYPAENGQVTIAFRDEGSAVTATSPTFKLVTLTAKNLDAYVDTSKELVQDSPTLIATLMSQFTEAKAKKIDSAVFLGTGSPMSGVFGAATGYSEVFSSGSTNFSALLSANIDNLIGKVLARPQDMARMKWYVHPTVFYKYIKGLKDTQGRYLYTDSVNGSNAPGTLLGYPVEFVWQSTSATAAGGTLAALGDLSGVHIGERLDTMSLFYDPYTDAANGNDRFFFWTRWAFAYALPYKMGRLVSAAT